MSAVASVRDRPGAGATEAVEVWWLRVDGLSEADVAPWRRVLDPDERQRADRFHFARNRVEYVAAHALARAALSEAAGCPPDIWRFSAGAYGKPAALVGGRPCGLHFNLSHTHGLTAVAVCRAAPLGIDVEALGRPVDPGIAARYFTPCEVAWLEAAGSDERTERFLRLWTLKEAYIKATGLGLSQPLDAFWFESLSPPAISFAPSIHDDPRLWRFAERRIDDRFALALGIRQENATSAVLRWREMTPDALSGRIGSGRRLS